MRSLYSKIRTALVTCLMLAVSISTVPFPAMAADHAEATIAAGDPGADLADVFVFLDPNDNSKVVLAMDVEGFVVPSESQNLSPFSPDVVFRFQIENTGDAIPDKNIDVTFSTQTSRNAPQTATIRLPNGRVFTALTTTATQNPQPNPFVKTTDSVSGACFFAGFTDDPFFFDIVGFNRFTASVTGGSPDPTKLQRGRDSFAGYNIHMITLELPASLLRGSAGNVIGVNGVTLRKTYAATVTGLTPTVTLSQLNASGSLAANLPGVSDLGKVALTQIDRMATPAVNTALIPYPRKNEFNSATPVDDKAGRFAGSIVATLTALGTNASNIATLASVAVSNGDYLRLNLATPNASVGVGEKITDTGYAGFPNGRRPGDDTIDTLLYFITNQTITTGDSVDSSDVLPTNTFPFFAPPHQPQDSGVIDDGTRN